jgi:hypothetical protein
MPAIVWGTSPCLRNHRVNARVVLPARGGTAERRTKNQREDPQPADDRDDDQHRCQRNQRRHAQIEV